MTEFNRQGSGAEPRPTRLAKRQRATLAVLALASFVVVLDYAGAIILLPSILVDLGGTLDQATWVVAAFVLTFALLLLPCARLADILGRRLLFICGVAVFTLASLTAALSPSLDFLIGARVVQGAGASMVEPAVFALIKAAIQREKQHLAFGVQGMAFLLGGALGPILPGAIVTVLSWQYLFWLNVLLGLVIVAGAVRVIPESHAEGTLRTLDLPGLVLSAAALFLLFFAIVEGPRFGWTSAPIVGSFVVAAVLFALFIVTESLARDPLVNLGLFTDRLFAVGNVVRATTEFTSLGIFLPLSHFLQVQLHHSALVTGLLLMSVIVGALITAPLAEALVGHVDVRLLAVPGFVLVAGGTFWAAHVSPETGLAFFIAPLTVAGAGIGALEGPAESAARQDIPAARADAAWRVSYTTYLLGIGLGVAVVSGVWRSRVQVNAADAVNTALLSCVVVALMGAVVALFFSANGKEETTAR